jgi:hypothetical protein
VLFRRRKPLHERLAEAGGVLLDVEAGGWHAHPPDLYGHPSPLGEAGVHGVPRARRWDAVGSASAPGLPGDAVHFVALADGTLVVDEDVPDGSLAPLADAIEELVAPPYRAEAVHRGDAVWAVAARRVEIAELPGLEGDELELAVHGEERSLTLDGRRTFGLNPELEQLVEGDAVVRGRRIDGDLWELKVDPL